MRVRHCTLAIGRRDGMGADVNARFVTEDGVAVPAVTAERMREIDRIAMEETGPNRNVSVALVLSEPGRLGEVPTFQRKIFASTRAHEIDATEVVRERPDVIVDALIGYGLREAPRGRAADLIAWANASGAPILSLDLPSGMNATTGQCPGACVQPSTTLTLALPKTGLAIGTAGDLWLADLGIPRATYERAGVDYTDPFGACDRVRLRLSPTPLDHPSAERL